MGFFKERKYYLIFSMFLFNAYGVPIQQRQASENAQRSVDALAQLFSGMASGRKTQKEGSQERLARLRRNIKNNLEMTPEEAKDQLIEYLLLRFTELFQELANILGDAVAKIANNKNAGEAVKRLPNALFDGFLLTAHLIKTMNNRQYAESLKHILQSTKCLFNKSERSGATCVNTPTVNAALVDLLSKASNFLLPIAQALVLGVEVGDRSVKGILPLSVSVIAPESPLEKELEVITQLVNNFLNLTDQLSIAVQ